MVLTLSAPYPRFGFWRIHPLSPIEPFRIEDLYDPDDADARHTLSLLNAWLGLATVLNELVRSMGQHDFYPFVMSRPVVKNLHFIDLAVRDARRTAAVQ